MRKRLFILSGFLALAAFCQSANATLLCLSPPASGGGNPNQDDGRLVAAVYREPAGTLDFFIQLQVTPGTMFSESTETGTGNFAGALTEVGMGAVNGNSSSGTRSSDRGMIEARFLSGIGSGTTGTETLAGLQLVSSPEPLSITLLGTVLAAFAWHVRRRHK